MVENFVIQKEDAAAKLPIKHPVIIIVADINKLRLHEAIYSVGLVLRNSVSCHVMHYVCDSIARIAVSNVISNDQTNCLGLPKGMHSIKYSYSC